MKISTYHKQNKDIIKTSFDLPTINSEAKNNLSRLIELSESVYKKQIIEVSEEIADNRQIKIVLMAGPSSSGKTTTSNLIKSELEKRGIHSIVISMDDFFKNRNDTPRLPDGSFDFENVEALDTDYFKKFINDLLNDNYALMPKFDFFTGSREEKLVPVTLNENSVVLIEGIHALNPAIVENHEANLYRIYICLNSNFDIEDHTCIRAQNLRLVRRIIRDCYTRGHSVEATIKMWQNVLAGENLYIKPYKSTANYMIDSTHMYEPLLYAKYASPVLKGCKDEKAIELYNMLSNCVELDKDCVPDDSLLWEFLVYKN